MRYRVSIYIMLFWLLSLPRIDIFRSKPASGKDAFINSRNNVLANLEAAVSSQIHSSKPNLELNDPTKGSQDSAATPWSTFLGCPIIDGTMSPVVSVVPYLLMMTHHSKCPPKDCLSLRKISDVSWGWSCHIDCAKPRESILEMIHSNARAGSHGPQTII